MRIAYCTPFTAKSAIGSVAAVAVDALRRTELTEVDICYPRGLGGRAWPDRGRVLGDDAAAELARYDAVIYNIGDHAGYHGEILRWSHAVPGVVVLHDLSLVHLVFNTLLAVEDDYFVATMQRWYGPEGHRAGLEALRHRGDWAWRLETVQQFPLTEVALESATAVVTHSRYAADALVNRYVGDVTALPLPVRQNTVDPSDAVDVGIPSDRVVVLQAGVINPNKHVPALLQGIAAADLADRVHLVICGHAQPGEMQGLRRQIEDLRLRNCTTVLGEVSDATLHTLRSRADIATVLRHPCGEAASAVLAESLAYGLPVLTVDDGCYREAPSDAVLRVSVPPDPVDIGRALRTLVDDPERRARASEAGQAFVQDRHSPEAYARGLLQAIHRSGTARRRVALAHDLASICARAGFGPSSSLIDRLAARAVELFAPEPRLLASSFPAPGEAR